MPSLENDHRRAGSPLLPTIPRDRIAQAGIIADGAGTDAGESGFLGFTSRVFTQTCLPYRDPMRTNPGLRAWVRHNGNVTLSIRPAEVPLSDGTFRYGIPYGKYPRLVLSWVTTQIVRRQSDRESDGTLRVEFTASLPRFLADLGQEWGGRSGKLLLEQLPLLFGAYISVTDRSATPAGSGVRRAGYQVADGYQLWWNRTGDMAAGGLWGNEVVLGAPFVADVLAAPIPIDLRSVALMAAHGPMAMDILAWLNYRLPAARKQTLITWEQLHAQFGAQYNLVRQFKAAFVGKLPAVHTVYPQARFDVEKNGLRVYPSPPAVQRKTVRA